MAEKGWCLAGHQGDDVWPLESSKAWAINSCSAQGGKLITRPKSSFYRIALIFERPANLVSH